MDLEKSHLNIQHHLVLGRGDKRTRPSTSLQGLTVCLGKMRFTDILTIIFGSTYTMPALCGVMIYDNSIHRSSPSVRGNSPQAMDYRRGD